MQKSRARPCRPSRARGIVNAKKSGTANAAPFYRLDRPRRLTPPFSPFVQDFPKPHQGLDMFPYRA